MLQSMAFDNFRSFETLNFNSLGRVNLIVGKNNSGKTSVLEAIDLLYSQDEWSGLMSMLRRRGEYDRIVTTAGDRERVLEIRHLFYGRHVTPDSVFHLSGSSQYEPKYVSFEIIEDIGFEQQKLFPRHKSMESYPYVLRKINYDSGSEYEAVPIYDGYYITDEYPRFKKSTSHSLGGPRFVTTESLSPAVLASYWDEIALTSSEDLVLQALRIIDPDIERIASVSQVPSSSRIISGRRGFVVRLKNSDYRIPIGNLGDGIWRLMCLAISAIQAKDSVLLIDEIDTGLHYSALQDMWKLLIELSERFQFQLFATTHSYDCIKALASVLQSTESTKDTMIHRIENGSPHAIPFSYNEIIHMANRWVEIR